MRAVTTSLPAAPRSTRRWPPRPPDPIRGRPAGRPRERCRPGHSSRCGPRASCGPARCAVTCLRLGRERHVKRDDVGLAQQGLEVGEPGAQVAWPAPPGCMGRTPARSLEPAQPRRHPGPDLAEAYHADRLAEQLAPVEAPIPLELLEPWCASGMRRTSASSMATVCSAAETRFRTAHWRRRFRAESTHPRRCCPSDPRAADERRRGAWSRSSAVTAVPERVMRASYSGSR